MDQPEDRRAKATVEVEGHMLTPEEVELAESMASSGKCNNCKGRGWIPLAPWKRGRETTPCPFCMDD